MSFPTLQTVAQKFGQRMQSRPRVHRTFQSPVDDLASDVDRLRRQMTRALNDHGHVADQNGLEVVVEYTVWVRAKAWPAVEGVTT